jgi:hypothetical protein
VQHKKRGEEGDNFLTTTRENIKQTTHKQQLLREERRERERREKP